MENKITELLPTYRLLENICLQLYMGE